MKQHAYFNTTQLSGNDLKNAIIKAKSQDDSVLLLFKNHRVPMSPSKVLEILAKAGKNWPLTSIRRSISTLTDRQDLIKTDKQVKGMYGENEHQWVINEIRHRVTHETQQAQQANLFTNQKPAA